MPALAAALHETITLDIPLAGQTTRLAACQILAVQRMLAHTNQVCIAAGQTADARAPAALAEADHAFKLLRKGLVTLVHGRDWLRSASIEVCKRHGKRDDPGKPVTGGRYPAPRQQWTMKGRYCYERSMIFMASLIERVTQLVRSPQGQRLAQRAQELARDPNTRHKLEQLRERLMKKR